MTTPTPETPPAAAPAFPFYVIPRDSLLGVEIIKVRDAEHWRHLQAMGIDYTQVPAPSTNS